MCLGIPGQIVEILDPASQMAKVDVAGVRRPVNVACVIDDDHPIDACLGDWVLVHVGFALRTVDEAAAATALEALGAGGGSGP